MLAAVPSTMPVTCRATAAMIRLSRRRSRAGPLILTRSCHLGRRKEIDLVKRREADKLLWIAHAVQCNEQIKQSAGRGDPGDTARRRARAVIECVRLAHRHANYAARPRRVNVRAELRVRRQAARSRGQRRHGPEVIAMTMKRITALRVLSIQRPRGSTVP